MSLHTLSAMVASRKARHPSVVEAPEETVVNQVVNSQNENQFVDSQEELEDLKVRETTDESLNVQYPQHITVSNCERAESLPKEKVQRRVSQVIRKFTKRKSRVKHVDDKVFDTGIVQGFERELSHTQEMLDVFVEDYVLRKNWPIARPKEEEKAEEEGEEFPSAKASRELGGVSGGLTALKHGKFGLAPTFDSSFGSSSSRRSSVRRVSGSQRRGSRTLLGRRISRADITKQANFIKATEISQPTEPFGFEVTLEQKYIPGLGTKYCRLLDGEVMQVLDTARAVKELSSGDSQPNSWTGHSNLDMFTSPNRREELSLDSGQTRLRSPSRPPRLNMTSMPQTLASLGSPSRLSPNREAARREVNLKSEMVEGLRRQIVENEEHLSSSKRETIRLKCREKLSNLKAELEVREQELNEAVSVHINSPLASSGMSAVEAKWAGRISLDPLGH